MKIFEVLHNYCVYESADYTYSLHRSKKGAVKEMIKLKEERWSDKYYADFERFGYRVTELRD